MKKKSVKKKKSLLFPVLLIGLVLALIFLFYNLINVQLSPGDNLILNYNFENGLDQWNHFVEKDKGAVSIVSDGEGRKILQIKGYGFAFQEPSKLRIVQGKIFNLTFFGKEGPDSNGMINIQNENWGAISTFNLDSSEWKKYSYTFTIPDNQQYKVVLATDPADSTTTRTSWFDDVILFEQVSQTQIEQPLSCGDPDKTCPSGYICVNGTCVIQTEQPPTAINQNTIVLTSVNVYDRDSVLTHSQCQDNVLTIKDGGGSTLASYRFNRSKANADQKIAMDVSNLANLNVLKFFYSGGCCLNSNPLGYCADGFLSIKLKDVSIAGVSNISSDKLFRASWQNYTLNKGISGQWVEETVSCIDSDSNETTSKYVRGTTRHQDGRNFTDSCIVYNPASNTINDTGSCSGNNCYLREFYCDNKRELFVDPINCSTGCNNGACIILDSEDDTPDCSVPGQEDVDIGTRLTTSNRYCASDGELKPMKANGATCILSYECSSNNCVNRICRDLTNGTSSGGTTSDDSGRTSGRDRSDDSVRGEEISGETESGLGSTAVWVIFGIVLIALIVLLYFIWLAYQKKKIKSPMNPAFRINRPGMIPPER